MSSVQGARSGGAITWKPRAPAAYDPSAWIESLRSAPIALPARPRASTHGPHRSCRLLWRVKTTVAPRARSRRATTLETCHVKVASG